LFITFIWSVTCYPGFRARRGLFVTHLTHVTHSEVPKAMIWTNKKKPKVAKLRNFMYFDALSVIVVIVF